MKITKFNPSGTREKKASGFIADMSSDSQYTMPAFVKLDHEECFTLYKSSEWLNAVITRIVNDCVKVKPRVRMVDREAKPNRKNKREMKEVTNFLRRPNPNKESFSDIRWKFILDHLVQGRGAIEKVNSHSGKVKELYSLTVNRFSIRQDESGNLKKRKTYRLKAGSTALSSTNARKSRPTRYFDIDECIHSVFRPSADTSYGIKPIDVLCAAVGADILRNDYNGRFFLNNGEASGVLSVEGMGKKDFTKFREYWKRSFKGTKNAHKMAVVNTKINYQKMSISNRDMEFSEYGKEIRNKIMAVFQMQPFVMGIVDNTTGKLNSGEQVTTYKNGAIKPILEKEAYLYTEEIVRDGFGFEDYEITFDAIDQLDAKEQSDVDRVNLENMVTTVNEVRVARGLPTVPWGDTPVSIKPGGAQIDPKTGMLIPPSEQGATDTATPAAAAKKPEKKPKPKPEGKKEIVVIEEDSSMLPINFAKSLYGDKEIKKLSSELALRNKYKNTNNNMTVDKFIEKCFSLVEEEEFLSDAKKKIDKLITVLEKVFSK